MPSNNSKINKKIAPSKGKTSVSKNLIQKKITRTERTPCSDEVQDMARKSIHPALAMKMLPSYVSGGFYMTLTKDFCDDHFPLRVPGDGLDIVLFTSDASKKYQVRYLSRTRAFSGGWRRFAEAHKLAMDDELVFEQIDLLTYKVLITRKSRVSDAPSSEGSELDAPSSEGSEMSDELGREDESAMSNISFEDFKVIVDSIDITSSIPSDIRRKYYELCTLRGEYLHEDVSMVDKQNYESIINMIVKTVSISERISAAEADIAVSVESLGHWNHTLGSFENQGMWVGFLRRSINDIFYRDGEMRRMHRAKLEERHKLEEKRKALETSGLSVLHQEEMETLELAMKELGNVPW